MVSKRFSRHAAIMSASTLLISAVPALASGLAVGAVNGGRRIIRLFIGGNLLRLVC